MSNKEKMQLVECPRDAIQGIDHFIPTQKKVAYINELMDSNLFDCIDFGSFVSPKAVPQMQDTHQVIEGIEKNEKTKLLAIIANEKGAEIGSQFEKIDFLGYPFSISETFQKRNTNTSISESYDCVKRIQELLSKQNKQQLVIYISMAFGNPYGDYWDMDIVQEWVEKLSRLEITHFSIADTTSEASLAEIHDLFSLSLKSFPALDWSIHLHSRVENASKKIEAAYQAGCRRFEGALMGYGGCPFAKDELVGNIPMEILLNRFGKGNEVINQKLMASFQNMIRKDGI